MLGQPQINKSTKTTDTIATKPMANDTNLHLHHSNIWDIIFTDIAAQTTSFPDKATTLQYSILQLNHKTSRQWTVSHTIAQRLLQSTHFDSMYDKIDGMQVPNERTTTIYLTNNTRSLHNHRTTTSLQSDKQTNKLHVPQLRTQSFKCQTYAKLYLYNYPHIRLWD